MWYTCRLDHGDPLLEPARRTWKRLGVPSRFVRAIDLLGQSKWWAFYHGTTLPERLTVQLRSRGGYVEANPGQLAGVVGVVEAERGRYEFRPHPACPAVRTLVLTDSNPADHWLPAEVFPADRFRVTA